MLSSSSEDEDTYFRGKQDLKFANLEWKDIQQSRLGRQIQDRIALQKGEIKNFEHKLKQMEIKGRRDLERQEAELTAQFNDTFKERLQIHLEKFKQEAKKLRLQLG